VWISIVSIAIAVAALAVSLSQTWIANKALRLGKIQDARRKARLDVSLKESVAWVPVDESCKYMCALLLVVNPAESETTLIRAELHITYSPAPNQMLVIKIPHEERLIGAPDEIVPVAIQSPLRANGALEGWFVFRLIDDLIGSHSIKDYNVVLYDSRGIMQSVHIWIIKEIAL